MYKDVKKKLLSVALCICMIIGMVQVAPRVKAASDTGRAVTRSQQVQATRDNGAVTATFTITLTWETQQYNGGNQKPEIASWTCDDPEYPYKGNENAIKLLDPENVTSWSDVGTYECKLFNNVWNFGNATIAYSITRAEVQNLQAELKDEATVQKYTGKNVLPQKSDINLTALFPGKGRKSIAASQYTISGGTTDCSKTAACTIDLDTKNYDVTLGGTQAQVGYTVAHDMSELECTASPETAVYESDMSMPTIQLRFNENGSEKVVAVDENLFQVSYYKDGKETAVDSVGEYTVKVTPGNGDSFREQDGHFFTGTATAKFTVTPKDMTGLRVWAENPDTGDIVELPATPSNKMSVTYKAGAAIEPKVTRVAVDEDADNIADLCSKVYPDATGAGSARIIITPDPVKTNYTGQVTVYYTITSDIQIKNYKFTNVPANIPAGTTEIEYDGKVHKLDTYEITNAAGDKVFTNQYNISYQYKSSDGMFHPVMDENTQLRDVGEKMVLITGQGTYQGSKIELIYEITPVDISNGKIDVTFDGGSSHSYTGKPIVPTPTAVAYNGKDIADFNSEFDFWCNQGTNINAGEVTMFVQGKNVNYRGVNQVKFTITKLDAKGIGANPDSYEYTRSEIAPTIMIGNYKLEEVDDYNVLYYDKNPNLKTAPKDVGRHSVTINVTSNNIECNGVQERTIDYEITKRTIKEIDVRLTGVDTQVSPPEIEWNGGQTRPGVIVGSGAWVEHTDYEIDYESDQSVSTTTSAAVIVTGKGNYTGQVRIPYKITPRKLSAEGVTHTVEVTPRMTGNDKVTPKPPYTATITLKDLNDSPLVYDADYTVKEIQYWDGVLVDTNGNNGSVQSKENWNKLTTASDSAIKLSDGNLEISKLNKAGKYKVVLNGGKRYKEERTITFECGIDISNYWVHIIGNDQISLPFDSANSENHPDHFRLYDTYIDSTSGKPVDNRVDYIAEDDFTVSYVRFDGRTEVTQAVGRIYVLATGKPENGCYGKTKRVEPDKKYNYFDITAPEWTAVHVAITGTAVEYFPNGRTGVPNITVTYDGKKLVGGTDYELEGVYLADGKTINPALQTAGDHVIYVVGIGNYESTNRLPYRYNVPRVDISDDKKVYCKPVTVSSTDIDQVSFELSQDDYILEEGDPSDPKNLQDYTRNRISSIEDDGNGNYYVEYVLTGQGNYTGELTVKVSVLKANLSKIKDSEEEAEVGDFFVTWLPSELLIKDPTKSEDERAPIEPAKFTIGYKVSEKQTLTLKKGKDYEISAYGTNRRAGKQPDNWVRIVGTGGYQGSCDLPVTLYTDITLAEPTDASLIANGAVIMKSEWKELYEKNGTDALLELKPLSFGEIGRIDPNEYKLTWTASLNLENPAAGTYKVIVNGLQGKGLEEDSNYYYGEKTFEFTIVNDIGDAQIVVGNNNTAVYQGKNKPIIVTAAGVGIKVTVDGTPLTLGKDYKITGHSNNAQLGQGDAVVSLEGIGQYTGTVDHEFKITYPISKLVAFVYDASNHTWVDTRSGTVQYRYTGNPVEPAVRLYCPADFPSNATAEDYLKEEALPNTIYATEFLNNTNAGTATIVIKGAPYFTDGGPDPSRYLPFQIGTASICPPANGGTVTYKSSKYGDVNNMVVDYMGENYDVNEDFGITLHDGVLELKENEHYRVYFVGDRKNVSDPANKPVIHFSGLGNYAGSEYEIPFEIRARSIKDASVNAEDVKLTYTDNMKEQQILDKLKLVLTTPRDRKQNLVFDTDYTIAGYYMDAGCKREVPVDKGVVSESGRLIPSVPGDYYVQVVGKGNFKDERAVHIVITKRDLTDNIKITFVSSMDSSCIVVDGVPDCTYNGEEHRPAVKVSYGIDSIVLRENRDYTVAYDNNVDAGETAKVTVTMIDTSNYKGFAERFFTIKQKDIAGEDMIYLDKNGNAYEDEVRYDWTKKTVHPDNFGKISDTSLRTDLGENDYEINYHDNNDDNNEQRNAGKVKMIFSGKGNYTGEKVFTYYIGEDISRAYTLVNGKRSLSVEYNGLMQAPKEDAISVEVSGSDTLDLITAEGEKRYAIKYFKNGFEYENRVEAKDIVDAGTYYVAVVGVPSLGTYAKSSEENTCTYVVQPRNIGPSYILVSGYDGAYYYTGHAIEPKGLTVEDTDLPVSSGSNDLQKRSVKLTNGIDYTVGYANNISAGKASIIVTGKGNYTGTRTAYFNILSSSTDGNNTWNGSSEGTGSISNGTTTIAASDIILGFDNSTYDCMMYNGYERTPTISINGINANEFTVTASNNVRPGVATLMITGRGNNYTGTILKNYKIMADLSKYGTIAAIEDQVYTGYQITPQVTLTCGGNLLNQGSDYTVTYMNNTNVGRATVTATASSDSYYVGSATGSFNISNTAGGMEITGYASSYTYTGYAITPDVVVTMNGRLLNRGTDYVVSYSNNTNVGTATMTVNGIGSFSGTKTINYTIEAKNIENCITTAVTNYKYTGNTYTPSVTITDSSTGKTLVAGTDYTIVYSNNTNPGTASITVTALSKNYTGTKVIPFKITSAAVSGLRTSAIKNSSLKLSWTSQDYADGYQICNSKNRVIATTRKNSYTVKGLSSCTTYKYKVRSFVENADGSRSYGSFSTAVSAKTRLNTPKLKAVSTKKGKVTLTWTKISKATGYEIYYSTKKNGIYTRLKTISKSSTRKYVDSGLASGEKYYYTIRAYRTTNGVKTYSSYNTIKAARVK